MDCFLCFSSDSKLQKFQGDMANDILKIIMFVLPERSIPESMDPVFVCVTCIKQVSFFYTLKKTSLQNCSLLKDFNAMLKGKNNDKSSELNIAINSDEFKDLFLSEDKDTIHIKEEDKVYDYCNQQLVNEELNLDYFQDEAACSSNNNSAQNYNIVGCYEFVDVNKFTRKDSLLTYNNKLKTESTSPIKRFKCTECNKRFTMRHHLTTHFLTHSDERPYECQICHRAFKVAQHLRNHNYIHTGEKPHKCDICQKSFSVTGSLISHKRSHNNVRPYHCNVCDKAFTQSGNLTTHMRCHTGEKPYKCHICEYMCASSSYLKVHIRSHTGLKPYSCEKCGKSYTSSNNLKGHNCKPNNI